MVTADAATARTSRRGGRITAVPDGHFGSPSQRIDATPLVGKQERVQGRVKTEAVTAWPVIGLRVDGGESTYVFSGTPLRTSDGWTEVVADAWIASGQEVTFGAAIGDDGTAWFDDLRLEVLEPAAVMPIRLAGRVVDSASAPGRPELVCAFVGWRVALDGVGAARVEYGQTRAPAGSPRRCPSAEPPAPSCSASRAAPTCTCVWWPAHPTASS